MRALLSVANRDGISTLARDLLALDVEIYATDGTREHLASDGVDVKAVTELTHLPPLAGGQVKTFHPQIYAGILARRDVESQMAELAEQGIGTSFSPTAGAKGLTLTTTMSIAPMPCSRSSSIWAGTSRRARMPA